MEKEVTENELLREKLGKKRILLTNHQRQRLAIMGKVLGHQVWVNHCQSEGTGGNRHSAIKRKLSESNYLNLA
jgi:hypothetical protein